MLRWVAWAALMGGVLVVLMVDHVPPEQIAPDSGSYASLAENLAAGDGYRIDVEALPREPEPSRYPPGYPLMLAPPLWLMSVGAAAVLISVALVVAVWAAARSMAGDVAAIVAVGLLVASEPFRFSAGTVMADVGAALLTVLALLAVRSGRPVLAGVLGAFSAWVRLAQVVIVAALPRRSWPVFAAGIVLLGVSKVWLGWGYESGQLGWGLEHIWSADSLGRPQPLPNGIYYPAVLLGLWGGVMLPGVLVVAGIAAWRRGGVERHFFFAVHASFLVMYLPYFWQDDRFVFPVMALTTIFAAALVGDAARSALEYAHDSRPVVASVDGVSGAAPG